MLSMLEENKSLKVSNTKNLNLFFLTTGQKEEENQQQHKETIVWCPLLSHAYQVNKIITG